jgi:thymidylate synthase (FAD)
MENDDGKIIMMPTKVLDHGHVRLVDFMGNDATVVSAARNSISGLDVKATSDDRALIRYLMRKRHTTPFESVVFTFELKIPIFVARQLVRHRTQALNEMSARYSVLPEEYYVPLEEHIQYQAERNKQGRADQVMEDADRERRHFEYEASGAYEKYRCRIENGMARELARINLPLSMYTQWWSTLSLHNLLHMLSLRKDPHAQYEARVYADALSTYVEKLCPHSWEAFCDFRLNAMTFSTDELSSLRAVISTDFVSEVIRIIEQKKHNFKTQREAQEFVDKLKRIVAMGL